MTSSGARASRSSASADIPSVSSHGQSAERHAATAYSWMSWWCQAESAIRPVVVVVVEVDAEHLLKLSPAAVDDVAPEGSLRTLPKHRSLAGRRCEVGRSPRRGALRPPGERMWHERPLMPSLRRTPAPFAACSPRPRARSAWWCTPCPPSVGDPARTASFPFSKLEAHSTRGGPSKRAGWLADMLHGMSGPLCEPLIQPATRCGKANGSITSPTAGKPLWLRTIMIGSSLPDVAARDQREPGGEVRRSSAPVLAGKLKRDPARPRWRGPIARRTYLPWAWLQ